MSLFDKKPAEKPEEEKQEVKAEEKPAAPVSKNRAKLLGTFKDK